MGISLLRAGALFSGIGGFCEGLDRASIRTTWSNEVDSYACKTYRLNFPGIKLIEKDIRDLSVTGDKLEPVDILTAGFPCQSFSQAGPRTGFNDERGKLFFEIPRLIREFGSEKPKVLFLENAPYLKYGDGGSWLLTIVNEIKRAGYWFRDANALELELSTLTGIPQVRTRLFLVAFSISHFRSGRFLSPENNERVVRDPISEYVDFEGEQSSEYYLPKDNRYYKMIKSESDNVSQKNGVFQLRKYRVRSKIKGVCPTLTANMGGGGHNVPFIWDSGGLRKLTEYECLRLQGFRSPPKINFPEEVSLGKRYHQIGNAVPPPMIEKVAESIKQKFTNEAN